MKMLKNIYVLIIIACSVASFWMISTKQMEQSDFLLRNVEALSASELPRGDYEGDDVYFSWNGTGCIPD